jgi:glycosyltransferase involved in cell wall biosynthesis
VISNSIEKVWNERELLLGKDGERMSVCVVTYPLGATATPTSDLLDILSELTTVSLVTADISEGAELDEDHEIVEISDAGTGGSIPIAAIRFLRNQFRMCRVLQTRNEDVVWFFGATSYLLPILFSRLIGKTVVLQPRGDVPLTLQIQWEQRISDSLARFLASIVKMLENVGYWRADAIVTYTPAMASELGLDRYEEKLYPNGARYIDTDRFSSQKAYQERDRVVGFIGRLEEEKRIRTLAEVAKQLPKDVTFVFVGDGELRGWLENELAEEITSGSVELTGWIDHDGVPTVLNRFRLLVLPSKMEGLPTVILEAFGCGTPVYATPVSGIPDVVRENETGFLIDHIDGEAMATEIAEILERDDLEEISRNTGEMIEERYSFEAAVTRYEEILSRCS